MAIVSNDLVLPRVSQESLEISALKINAIWSVIAGPPLGGMVMKSRKIPKSKIASLLPSRRWKINPLTHVKSVGQDLFVQESEQAADAEI